MILILGLILSLISTTIFFFFVFDCLKNKYAAWPVFALIMLVLASVSLGINILAVIQETP